MCQYLLWYNNVYNIGDVKGVVMLYFDLVDILILLVGFLFGVIFTTGIDSVICDDCQDERRNENA